MITGVGRRIIHNSASQCTVGRRELNIIKESCRRKKTESKGYRVKLKPAGIFLDNLLVHLRFFR